MKEDIALPEIELSPADQELLSHIEALRAYYEPENRIGQHLDALADDLRKGKRGKHSKKLVKEGLAIQAELGPAATASRAIRTVIGGPSA